MTSYIFSFSYIDKVKMEGIKTAFIFNPLSKSYNINFLTKKNFNSFFNDTYLSLGNILSGKYLIISSNNNNIDFKKLIKDVEEIQSFLKSFEEEIYLFGIIYNKNYYTNEFLIESNKINQNKIFDYINMNRSTYITSLIIIEVLQYALYLSRINNLQLLTQRNFVNTLY